MATIGVVFPHQPILGLLDLSVLQRSFLFRRPSCTDASAHRARSSELISGLEAVPLDRGGAPALGSSSAALTRCLSMTASCSGRQLHQEGVDLPLEQRHDFVR